MSGRIIPPPGVSMAGVYVHAFGRGVVMQNSSGLLAADGPFEMRQVMPGTYGLRAATTSMGGTQPGDLLAEATVEVGTGDLTGITIQGIAAIPVDLHGRFVQDGGKPPVSSIVVTRSVGLASLARSDGNGSFVLERL